MLHFTVKLIFYEKAVTDMEALDDSRNCQTLGVSPAELGAYELLVKFDLKSQLVIAHQLIE